MPKRDPKSSPNYSALEELALMRMSIHAMRDQINHNLDAMLDQINRLIPADDTNRSIKYKNFTTQDWHDFLERR